MLSDIVPTSQDCMYISANERAEQSIIRPACTAYQSDVFSLNCHVFHYQQEARFDNTLTKCLPEGKTDVLLTVY